MNTQDNCPQVVKVHEKGTSMTILIASINTEFFSVKRLYSLFLCTLSPNKLIEWFFKHDVVVVASAASTAFRRVLLMTNESGFR